MISPFPKLKSIYAYIVHARKAPSYLDESHLNPFNDTTINQRQSSRFYS